MPSFLSPYLTEYDENLSADTYIDPVGTLIIWSAFGRQVFRNRVNSISNDVRNYTLNLFHHFLVRKLVVDDAVQVHGSLQQVYGSKDSLAFKHACLILLENLFVYSLLQHEKLHGVEVQTAGVLGISKARHLWNQADHDPTLVFTHEAKGQILVRQLGLGVSGRYKTPLIEMGFFDSAYRYHQPASQPRWAEVEAFVCGERHGVLAKLEHAAYSFLKKQVPALRRKGKLKFRSDVPDKLTRAYALAFSSPRTVGEYARAFWLQQTGLDSGASGALLKILAREGDALLSPRRVVTKAIEVDLPPPEKAKLEQIARIEPFLADCALLFSLMTSKRDSTIADVAARWKAFGRNGNTLRALAQPAANAGNFPPLAGSEAGRRFARLQYMARNADVQSQVRELARYHQGVMQGRGQSAWLTIDEAGRIKVHARTTRRIAPEDRPPGAWENDYYVPQFRRLVRGLMGVQA